MKSSVHGSVGVVEIEVTEEMTANLEGLVAHPVYSTYWLTYHAELAARRAIQPHFEEGENAVGAAIELRHRAMAGIGARVRIEARVVWMEGAKIRCEIAARAGNKNTLLAEGIQDQVVMRTEVLEKKISEAVR